MAGECAIGRCGRFWVLVWNWAWVDPVGVAAGML